MAPYGLPKAGANGGAPWRKAEFHGILFCSAASLTTPFSQVTITVKEDSVSWNLRIDIMSDSAVRATETAKGGIKYELVLSEPSVNDPPKKESITSPPKAMSVEEIEQKLKAAEERRLQLEAEKLNQINEKKNKLQEANQKRQEYNNNFIQSTKETLEQKMETFENNREAKLKALQEKLKEHERHIEEVRQSKSLNLNDGTEETTPVASSG